MHTYMRCHTHILEYRYTYMTICAYVHTYMNCWTYIHKYMHTYNRTHKNMDMNVYLHIFTMMRTSTTRVATRTTVAITIRPTTVARVMWNVHM